VKSNKKPKRSSHSASNSSMQGLTAADEEKNSDNSDSGSPTVNASPIASPAKAAGLDSDKLHFIDVDDIEIGPRLREVDEDALSPLMESMAERGQLHPILVRLEGGRDGSRRILIAGLHRLVGARRLGWRRILCRIVETSDVVEPELLEIDENVARVPLSSAAAAIYLGRRHALYEQRYGSAKTRGAHAANASMGRANASANLAPAFTATTAAITGVAERSIQRGVARAAALGVEQLKRIVGTCLDHGIQLDALAALSPQIRDQLVERAVAGEQVSATAAVKKVGRAKPAPVADSEPPKPIYPIDCVEIEFDLDGPFDNHVDEHPGTLETLKKAWLQAPALVREQFLAWLASSGATSPEDEH
jgi:ParB family chromosome partitioning protein